MDLPHDAKRGGCLAATLLTVLNSTAPDPQAAPAGIGAGINDLPGGGAPVWTGGFVNTVFNFRMDCRHPWRDPGPTLARPWRGSADFHADEQRRANEMGAIA